VPAENFIPVVAGAGYAPHAAGNQNSHAQRNQKGKTVSVALQPLNQAIHRQLPRSMDFFELLRILPLMRRSRSLFDSILQ
jgi:hypothetical protein